MSRGHHCLSPAHVLFLSCCFQTHLEIDGLSAAGEEGSCIQTQIGAFNHKLVRMAPSSSNKVLVNKNHLLVCILLPDSKGFCHISLLCYSSVYSHVWRPSKLHAYANFPLFWQINFTSFIPPLSLLLNHSLGLKRSRTWPSGAVGMILFNLLHD